MIDGTNGVTEALRVGFLEVADDFPQRLPSFVEAYDAVIIGEGEFQFVSHLVDDILGIPVPKQESTARAIQKGLGQGLGRAKGFFPGT